MKTVTNKEGDEICLSRNGRIIIIDVQDREEHYATVIGAKLKVHENQVIKPATVLVEWDPYSFVIVSEVSGMVDYRDIIPGITMIEEVEEATSFSRMKVVSSNDEKLHPAIIIKDEDGKIFGRYPLPNDSLIMCERDAPVFAGDVLAKIPKDTTRQMDITGGLPRIVELFEGRKPKEPAVVAEIDGVVAYGNISRGQQKIHVENDYGVKREYSVPKGKYIHFKEGEFIKAGEQLIDGARSPHDILNVLGEKELQKFLVDEIQEVYRLQGVTINDKHIEIIIRQMMRWMEVDDVGDTEFIVGERVDKFRFQKENDRVVSSGGDPAKGHPLLVGITKASLSTDSFISAASFQETTRVLTEAAIEGKVDFLRGLKENVIMGKLIPAGTGMTTYRDVELEPDESIEDEEDDLADDFSLDNIIKSSQEKITGQPII
jgi:DNA-directed RNA polymerase subunit beta'